MSGTTEWVSSSSSSQQQRYLSTTSGGGRGKQLGLEKKQLLLPEAPLLAAARLMMSPCEHINANLSSSQDGGGGGGIGIGDERHRRRSKYDRQEQKQQHHQTTTNENGDEAMGNDTTTIDNQHQERRLGHSLEDYGNRLNRILERLGEDNSNSSSSRPTTKRPITTFEQQHQAEGNISHVGGAKNNDGSDGNRNKKARREKEHRSHNEGTAAAADGTNSTITELLLGAKSRERIKRAKRRQQEGEFDAKKFFVEEEEEEQLVSAAASCLSSDDASLQHQQQEQQRTVTIAEAKAAAAAAEEEEEEEEEEKEIPTAAAAAAPKDTLLYPVGTRVKKFFHGYGWFYGKVVSLRNSNSTYHIRYEDDDEEGLVKDEMGAIVWLVPSADGCLFPALRTVRHPVGTPVKKFVKSRGCWIDGSIVSNKPTSYRLSYVKGDDEEFAFGDPEVDAFVEAAASASRREELQYLYPVGTNVKRHCPITGDLLTGKIDYNTRLYKVKYFNGEREEFGIGCSMVDEIVKAAAAAATGGGGQKGRKSK